MYRNNGEYQGDINRVEEGLKRKVNQVGSWEVLVENKSRKLTLIDILLCMQTSCWLVLMLGLKIRIEFQ